MYYAVSQTALRQNDGHLGGEAPNFFCKDAQEAAEELVWRALNLTV